MPVRSTHEFIPPGRRWRRIAAHLTLAFLLLGPVAPPVAAGPRSTAGPYQVELTTDPPVIPLGRAFVVLHISDASGEPLADARVAVLLGMPAMKMGEREEKALPVPGQPGFYRAPAVFGMEGAYVADITIEGTAGTAKVSLALRTGQDTSGRSGFPWAVLVLGTGLGAAAILLLWRRLRSLGVRVEWRAAFSRSVLGALALLILMSLVSLHAVQHWRRPGAMTPIEGQAMDMNVPPPVGVAPVVLAVARQGNLDVVVRYSGQAVGYVEQDVVARVQGTITDMPVYVGDRVTSGQLLASLDTSQLQPLLAERRAALAAASRQVQVATAESRMAAEQLSESHTEVAMQASEVQAAQSNLAAVRTQVDDARAGVQAALADQAYWRKQVARSRELEARGVFSAETYQKDQASAAGAESRVRQARARHSQVQAQVRSAQATLDKAETGVRSHQAHVSTMQAGLAASHAKVAAAQAMMEQANASYSGAVAQLSYSRLLAQVDGVVLQRLVSPGVLVNPGQAILRLAQVRPIRLQASVAAADLARIRKGAQVRVAGQDDGRPPVSLRVTSVGPGVDATSRTGVVEALYPNRDGRFTPGAYVVMHVTVDRVTNALIIPEAAIHTASRVVDESHSARPGPRYVWVAQERPGSDDLEARRVEVAVGPGDGVSAVIRNGLQAGDQVIVAGADYLKDGDTVASAPSASGTPSPRAASSQGSPSPVAQSSAPSMTTVASPLPSGAPGAQAVTVEVLAAGYRPDSVTVRAGQPLKLTFIRRTDQGCGTEVLVPDFNLKATLPLNQPVTLDLVPARAGVFKFTCGMRMLRGKLIVQ